MDPYVANEDEIPSSDLYADVPCYGRYFPRADDYRVDPQHVTSQSDEAIQYWKSVLDLCDDAAKIYPADDGGRDVFAVGGIIVKSSHLHNEPEIDYSYADSNEVEAVAIARGVLRGVRVPDIYFSGKVNGRQVLVQERLPGVALNVAWPYLSQAQKDSFKRQARQILQQLRAVKPPDAQRARRHVVPDPNILTNGRVHELEGSLLFSATDDSDNQDASFMHNDFTTSNCIVDKDRIVGIIDWEMAGFFGWKTAGEVHRRIRTPQREHFANANLSEERLRDIMWWNDLYDEEREA